MWGGEDGGEVEGYRGCKGNGGLAEAEGGFGEWIFLGALGGEMNRGKCTEEGKSGVGCMVWLSDM